MQWGTLTTLRLEINYMLRCHTLSTVEVTSQASKAFAVFPIRTLAPVEIFASKIVALGSRAAARDLYDINNMIYLRLFDKPDLERLRKCTVLYLAITGNARTCSFNFTKMTEITERTI